MNTEIRSLQLLEDDLEALAARERERLASVDRAMDDGADGPRRPRRHRVGGRGWSGVAAALVAVLVLAGGIGFLSRVEPMSGDSNSAGGGGSDASVETNDSVGGNAGSGGSAPQPASAPGALLDSTDFANLSPDERAALGYAEQSTKDAAGGRPTFGVPQQQGDLTKIIRDGRIGIVIGDGAFSKGVSRVTLIAKQNKGFVLESRSRDERSGSLTLRIPAKRFDDTMLALRGLAGELGGEVEFQDITGQDVTAEFIDLQARLDILKDRRDLLRDLQKDATNSSEILRLASLIDDAQLQIESIQGRLRFLKDQVAEATIKVEVRERDVQRDGPGPDPENPSLTESFALAVQGFLRIVGAIVIGLGYLIPLGAIALLVWGAVTLVRRRDRGAS